METLLFRFVDFLIKAIEQHKGLRVKMWPPLLVLQIEQADYVSSRVKKNLVITVDMCTTQSCLKRIVELESF